ncbi:phosphate propanoyltransferase [Salisediminibacterium selenitireducens]|uniref:Phosphate propanoyltransferase n=1 Tax=Bacillus selenitireducens (strain ATCC 700615 / DSM 15326 / MLS10) TaxID=439292 RepID=D6Y0M5_BACIE|nr:phosphate propanoyltransferase [Salisediminibacterium selenitireducens]ADI00593.1 Propanediol utilization protein [[Bacillus] selenitireducens MLS10]
MDRRQVEQEIYRSIERVLHEMGIDVIADDASIPVSVSARHVHLSPDDVNALFGDGYSLTYFRDISQPGQYACQEKVTLKGPKGKIENVRILGPARGQTQVEVSKTDARTLGVDPPVRRSGVLKDSEAITIEAANGRVIHLNEGLIIADRHIHMTPEDARRFAVKDGEKVAVAISGEKPGVLGQVTIRVKETYKLDMHIDTDDGNAFLIQGAGKGKIVKESW